MLTLSNFLCCRGFLHHHSLMFIHIFSKTCISILIEFLNDSSSSRLNPMCSKNFLSGNHIFKKRIFEKNMTIFNHVFLKYQSSSIIREKIHLRKTCMNLLNCFSLLKKNTHINIAFSEQSSGNVEKSRQ